MTSNNVLMHVKDLVKHFPITQGIVIQRQVGAVRAVDGISFDIHKGETLGLVGESGCGKSTTGRTILQLYRPTSGNVVFDDVDLVKLKGNDLRKMRRKMQMIFQDPYASLNPRMTISEIIGEPLVVHNVASGKDVEQRVEHLLELVGLSPTFANRFPHEFSGGQRQRIGVARALALQPSSSSVTNRSPWTCPSRRRWSTCWKTCRRSSISPTSSSHMTFPWYGTSATGWR
jgi:oligopeptide transport system ATP-binding protein